MHTKLLWRNVYENIQLLIRLRKWGRSEIGEFCNEGLGGIESGTCPKLNLSVLASLLLMCVFAHICNPYNLTFHNFWPSLLNYWQFILSLKTFLNQRVRNTVISKRIALYWYAFVSDIETRAQIEVVRERVIFEGNRGADRNQ
jgi:hypothetical protein